MARSYHQMGNAYTQKGEYPRAIENFQKALNIRLQYYGEIHPDVAASYYRLGNVYEQLGDLNKAIEYYGKAVAIDEETLGAEHPFTLEDKATLEALRAKLKEQENTPAE